MANVPFAEDFRGEFEIVILTDLLQQVAKPLMLCRDADEPSSRLQFRISAIDKLQNVQQRLDLLMSKLKAGMPGASELRADIAAEKSAYDAEIRHGG